MSTPVPDQYLEAFKKRDVDNQEADDIYDHMNKLKGLLMFAVHEVSFINNVVFNLFDIHEKDFHELHKAKKVIESVQKKKKLMKDKLRELGVSITEGLEPAA